MAVLARSGVELDEVAGQIREMGRTGVALYCDVTRPEEIRAAVERALEAVGGVDVLVNNAGGPLFNAPFLEIRPMAGGVRSS